MMDSQSTAKEDTIINYLRHEAYAVRDCFTKYSIQILAVSGAILIPLAQFQKDLFYIGFLAFFPILLIMYVLMMGIHKYGTSNRLLGYELHLQRTAHFMSSDHCHAIMRQVGWEEAMRAWRVVQPTLWGRIYQPAGHHKTGSSRVHNE
jgi:hypothetical protein